MIKAVVFDCFGVLAEDGWSPFKRRYIGKNIELANAVADLGKQNEYGLISNRDYYGQVADLIGVEKAVVVEALGRRVPNDSLFEFIKLELKPKYKIGLLSNANFDVAESLFTKEQAEIFDASVLSYEARLIKPDPRMFELMASRLGVDPAECIFVDDIERYCSAAADIGMKSILYVEPEQIKSAIFQFL